MPRGLMREHKNRKNLPDRDARNVPRTAVKTNESVCLANQPRTALFAFRRCDLFDSDINPENSSLVWRIDEPEATSVRCGETRLQDERPLPIESLFPLLDVIKRSRFPA